MSARLCAVVISLAMAAVPLQTPRDVRPEPTGTATIGGVVAASDTGRPLRLTQVRLSGDMLLTSRTFVTGADGRFLFAGLAAGRYSLEIFHGGFVRAQYGAKRPNGPGTSVVVADGQQATSLDVRLTKFASISGTVFDQSGEPIPGVSVEALVHDADRRPHAVVGVRQCAGDRRSRCLSVHGPRGRRLSPCGGSEPRDRRRADALDDRRRSRPAGAGIRHDADRRRAERQEAGHLRARVLPGTTELANAATITLKDGEDRSGIDLRLQFVPTARLEGTIVGPDGQPAANVPLAAKIVSVPYSMDLFRVGDPGTARSDAQGRFSFPFVAPGQYEITARLGGPPPNLDPFFQTVPSTAGLLFAQSTVTVAGSDQTVSLSLQPGITLSGSIVFDGPSTPPTDIRGMRVTLAAPAYAPSIGATATQASPDGTFRITGVAPGRYRLSTSAPGSSATSGWALRSAIVNTPSGPVDALDVPVEVRLGQNFDNVVITFTDRPAELSGALQTPAGVVASDYFIIVFATDRAQWGPQSRRTVMARPTTAGRYSVRNLPPGEYYFAAVTDVLPNEWFDPAFLELLVPAAKKLTIAEGEQKMNDFRIGGS